jgi:hypothetical protein
LLTQAVEDDAKGGGSATRMSSPLRVVDANLSAKLVSTFAETPLSDATIITLLDCRSNVMYLMHTQLDMLCVVCTLDLLAFCVCIEDHHPSVGLHEDNVSYWESESKSEIGVAAEMISVIETELHNHQSKSEVILELSHQTYHTLFKLSLCHR